MPFVDYYKALGVNINATESEIKDAYRKLSKKFHPDVNQGDKFFEEKFKEIQNAYEVLSNNIRRQEYNKSYYSFFNIYEQRNTQSTHTEQQKEAPKQSYSTTTENKKPSTQKSNKTFYFILFLIISILIGILKGAIRDQNVNNALTEAKENNSPNINSVSIDSTINVDTVQKAELSTNKIDTTSSPSNDTVIATTQIYQARDFIGKWKDDNSICNLYSNGNLYVQWDNGQVASGQWQILNNQLNFDFSAVVSNKYKSNDFYNILSMNETQFQYQSANNNGNQFIYTAKKISN